MQNSLSIRTRFEYYLLGWDLHTEVTAGDHDAIGCLKNLIEVFETLYRASGEN